MANIYHKAAIAIAFSSIFSSSFAGGWLVPFGSALPNRDEMLQREAERDRMAQESILRDLELAERIDAIKRKEMELELLRLKIENERSITNHRQPPARVKVVVAHVMQPTAVYRDSH